MNVIRFLARDAADAIAQVRAQLGANAVVLSVKQLPSKGVSRLWRKPLLEVCASLPPGLPNGPGVNSNSVSPPAPAPVVSLADAIRISPMESRAGAMPIRPELKAEAPTDIEEPQPRYSPVALDAWAAECGPPMSWSEALELAGVDHHMSPQWGELPRKTPALAGKAASSRRPSTFEAKRTEPKAATRKATPRPAPRRRKATARSSSASARKAARQTPVAERAISVGRNAGLPASTPRAGVCALPEPGLMDLVGQWSSGKVLFQLGLHPLMVEKVIERARARFGDRPPNSFAEEMAQVKSALNSFWRPVPVPALQSPALHGFIGPPGSGKTTTLCKWLAKSVLVESRNTRVWRLDSRAANFAGLLDLFGEILAVPVDREWSGGQSLSGLEMGFLDFPGVNPQDQAALEQLRGQLHGIPRLEVHLVLNAAYDLSVLLEQIRALEVLPVSDLIFTHLDEEKRHGKLWNFILGTKFTIRFLSGGQNIPGDFSLAAPNLLISS